MSEGRATRVRRETREGRVARPGTWLAPRANVRRSGRVSEKSDGGAVVTAIFAQFGVGTRRAMASVHGDREETAKGARE
jgi:hypothetical protein